MTNWPRGLKDIKIYDRVIGKSKLCRENENEMKFIEEEKEFRFGNATSGYTVIGQYDLFDFLKDLNLI